jgi:hypothetical protein
MSQTTQLHPLRLTPNSMAEPVRRNIISNILDGIQLRSKVHLLERAASQA